MDFSPAHTRLYLGLMRDLAIDLFRFGWEYEWPTLPDRYLIEVEPGLFAVRKDLKDILPERDVIFGDGHVSWFSRVADMLCKFGVCRSTSPRKYVFCIDWEDFDRTLIEGRPWERVTLSEVAGAYLGRNSWMVERYSVVPSGPHRESVREIMLLFCAAGFAVDEGRRFVWTCDEIELIDQYPDTFWRGAEDGLGNRY